GSLAITLPPEWIEKHELRKGDEVSVVGGSILLVIPIKEVSNAGI
ncbi:histidine kinase, partial [Archaeoglobales archaeon]